METDMERKYEQDLENFCDHGDVGDDWCGEEVVQAIITWIKSNIEFDDSVLSIGCGNAALLLQLYQLGYANLTGIDASQSAIKLATEISHQESAKIQLQVGNVLNPIPAENKESVLNKNYKLLLDKGLFDAITMKAENMKEVQEKYLKNTIQLLEKGGILLLASCNHTEKELESHIGKGFKVKCVIPTPVLKFGGKKGHNVTVVAFQKAN